ncbi:MAG: zinc-binding dehydrogenase [Betaproteobacteria bacterium]|nr:zinc-binding dehydrogenase [Betaproteobacteria bacterium]
MRFHSLQSTATTATLELRDGPIPEPGPQQLLVRMRAAGLNRGEFIIGHGLTKAGTSKPIGMEGAGEIVKLGTEVSGYALGDAVMGRCSGAFAEYAVMDANEAIAKPANLTWEEAAAIPLTFLVVHDMLIAQGKLQAGEWVLITGVSSGVGVAAMQVAKALGARVIGTSGSQDKLDRLQALGLDVGLCTRTPDFHDAVMAATGGHGVDLVVNAVGGSVFAECVRTMAFQGRLATVGYVDGVLKSEIDIQALHAKRLVLFGVSNKLRNAPQRAAGIPAFVADLLPAIAAGRIHPVIDRVYPFEQLAEAKAHMEANRHLGKIVLAMPTATSATLPA